MDILNPSTIHGALIIGIFGGLISGVILGFFSGKTYESRKTNKVENKTKGNGNIIVQNSNIKESDFSVKEK